MDMINWIKNNAIVVAIIGGIGAILFIAKSVLSALTKKQDRIDNQALGALSTADAINKEVEKKTDEIRATDSKIEKTVADKDKLQEHTSADPHNRDNR